MNRFTDEFKVTRRLEIYRLVQQIKANCESQALASQLTLVSDAALKFSISRMLAIMARALHMTKIKTTTINIMARFCCSFSSSLSLKSEEQSKFLNSLFV